MKPEGFPRRFGDYVLLKPLGRGGMGALYLAVHGHRGMEKLCAVKTALPNMGDKGYVQRFRDEAKVVVRLSHGNLVTVFDVGEAKGELFLAMDFVEGKDLRAVWNRCAQKGTAFPIAVAVHITRELVRGLAYAHGFEGLHLVHRDVSPPNVLVSYTGEVKLTDFGLATSTLKLEKTAPGVIYGKVSYMAPEQARGEALDGRTDLYAAGIILWELLTGKQLFPPGTRAVVAGDSSDDEVLERVREPEIMPPSRRASRVPPQLDAICMKALALDPNKRYQSGDELRADLAAFLAKTAPATDGEQVARFLRDLFADQINKERADRERLVASAVAVLDHASAATRAKPVRPAVVVRAPVVRHASPTAVLSTGAAANTVGAPARLVPTVASENLTTAAYTQPHSEDFDEEETTNELKPAEEISKMVGTILAGRYQIKRLIGEGGMGRVYEAEHIEIRKRVAVKVLHPAYTRTPDVVERFRREARAASKIGHPNIVNVTDSGTTSEGAFFFVMEFIEGIELGLSLHRTGPFSVPRMLKIALQMCESLQAAHDAGVIHRDLKPENVLLVTRDSQDDLVKVLDFGIAKSAEIEEDTRAGRKLTRPGVAMGTPEYMAPEQAAGRPADPRSDIYAVGSIMYEMLTNHPPYDGDNVMEILHKKANELPKPLRELRPDLPRDVADLVERAMARTAAERPQSMGDLARDIRLLAAQVDRSPPPIPGAMPTGMSGGPNDTSVLLALNPAAGIPALRLSGRTLTIGAAALLAIGALVIIRAASSSRPNTSLAPATGAAAASSSMAPTPAPAGLAPAAPTGLVETTPAAQAAADPVAAPAAPLGEVPEVNADPMARKGASSASRIGRALSPDASRKLLREAQELLKAQKYENAHEAFGRLLGSPYKGAALVGLGNVAFQQRNYEEAVARARAGARVGGGVKARVLLGDAYFRLDKYREARKAYDEALALDPNNDAAKRGSERAARRID